MSFIESTRRLRLTLVAAAVLALAPAAAAQWTSAANIDSTGTLSTSHAGNPSLSADGRFVVFYADGPLVPVDTNGLRDIYLRDRVQQQTELISVSLGGTAGLKGSFEAAISDDGRFVAFESDAKDLVAGDSNGARDVFLRDRQEQKTVRVSVATGGGQANGASSEPSISGDGRFVTFSSYATNLVPGDTNAVGDVFVHDRLLGKTKRVSVRTGGAQAAGGDSEASALSGDGRFVAFASRATNLVAHDTNASFDVFLHDRVLGATTLLSRTAAGVPGNGVSGSPSVSADGSTVAFHTFATDILQNDVNGRWDVVSYDIATGVLDLVSQDAMGFQSNDHSLIVGTRRNVSANGRFVAFASRGTNLPPFDNNGNGDDVFRRDRWFGAVKQASISTDGQSSNGTNNAATISADGRHVAYMSWATNLVPNDTNNKTDVLVHSPWLNLSAAQGIVTAGQILSLTTWRGTPGKTLLYGISSIQGVPYGITLSAGKFNAFGTSTLLAPVPALPLLEGLDVGFRAAAQTPSGEVSFTQEIVIQFR